MHATTEKMFATLKTTAEARVSDLSAASDSLMAVAEHLTLHLGVLVASSLASIALSLLLAWLDARRLRGLGVVRPFPWGFAAFSGLVYVIGRHVVLRRVLPTRGAPLWVSIALYVLWYTGFAVWAAITVTAGLSGLG